MKLYTSNLLAAGIRHMVQLCAGLDKWNAIAVIAGELQRIQTTITATELCHVLNEAGYRTSYGTKYTGTGRGAYKPISAAYHRFVKVRPGVATAIAEAFTNSWNGYAYC